jgi:amidase
LRFRRKNTSHGMSDLSAKVVAQRSERVIDIFPDPPVFNLGKRLPPLARVLSGTRVRFHTTDAGYQLALKQGFDADPQVIHRLNALTGPVFIEGAEPGDALVAHVEEIAVGNRAYVVYVDRWGHDTFGMNGSWIEAFPIVDDGIVLDETSAIPIKPMIGCAGLAPLTSSLSSLSPTAPEGGNMDLRQLEAGSRLLLPVKVDGGLFALGDLHATMGTGEPAGAGFECAGSVLVTFEVRKGIQLFGPRIETSRGVSFLGSDPHELYAAKQRAIQAAWRYLVDECEIEKRRAFAIISGLLNLEFGGPAGANVLASFDWAGLANAGVSLQTA